MPNLSLEAMRAYLSQSISSLNQNKLRGLLAEVDLRDHLANLGFGDRVSRGGWIARTKGDGIFGDSTIALFPEIITPGHMYPPGHPFPAPDRGLHTICSTFIKVVSIASFVPRLLKGTMIRRVLIGPRYS